MSARRPRPVRNLAAWGYESKTSGDRIEVDVWTVNEREAPEDDPFDRAREAFGARVSEVLAVAGDVAKVDYAGAAGTGYRRISADEAVPQQAFAGAAREAGGTHDPETGHMRPGADPAVIGPDLSEVIRHGRDRVLPVVRRNFRELGERVDREPSRDEDEEEVETRPINGYRNVVRVFTRGSTFRYHADSGDLQIGGDDA